MGTVYLLHFIRLGGKDPRGTHAKLAHAGHYVGFTEGRLQERLNEHRTGYASKLTGAVVASGLSFLVARLWTGVTMVEEQRIKNRGGAARLCPLCTPGTTQGVFQHVPKKSRWERTKGKKRRFLMKVRTR